VLAWLAGFEIGPGLHIGLHDLFAHHRHDGDRGDGPTDHGRHSVAHRAAATIAAGPVLWLPPPLAARATPAPEQPVLRDSLAAPLVLRARGPPPAVAA
jgi:hypothetical protein